MKDAHKPRAGTVLVEFLLVFPAFLVLSLFTLEIGLMWSDKHVTRLAAFEAARSLASAPLPEQQNDGSFSHNPCDANGAMAAARQAALRRMAIITPSIFYIDAQLTTPIPGITTFENILTALPSPARRLFSRWPTASTFTRLQCAYDSTTHLVTTGITYYRSPQTPIVGRVMWVAHMLARAAADGTSLFDISFKHDFFGLEGRLNVLQQNQLQSAFEQGLNVINDTSMGSEQAASFLSSIPGAESILGTLANPSAMDVALASVLPVENATTLAALSQIEIQSQLLTSAVYATPKPLRFIPLHVKSFASRKILGPNATMVSGRLKDEAWEGVIRGVAKLNTGVFRSWSRQMGENPTRINGGEDIYAN